MEECMWVSLFLALFVSYNDNMCICPKTTTKQSPLFYKPSLLLISLTE